MNNDPIIIIINTLISNPSHLESNMTTTRSIHDKHPSKHG